jgi:hypothetical protein
MSSASQPLTTLEQNKILVHRWFEEVWNQSHRETIFELLTESGVLHDGARDIRGAEEFSRFHDALRAQFSEFRFIPLVTLAEDDRVCVHWNCSMTHTASRKPLHISGTSIVRVENGRFVEGWQNWDAAHLYTQLTGQPTLSL